jgi:hypothetical protein
LVNAKADRIVRAPEKRELRTRAMNYQIAFNRALDTLSDLSD